MQLPMQDMLGINYSNSAVSRLKYNNKHIIFDHINHCLFVIN